MGAYQEAIESCEKAQKLIQGDKELLYDMLKLKGICCYRLNDPLEAIKNLAQANRYKS